MASSIKNIQEFNPEEESIGVYLERVHFFMEANGIEDNKKAAVMLSLIGSKTYGVLRNILSPAKPNQKSYKQLVEVLQSHYEPKPNIIAARFHFHRRIQTTEESLSNYIAELKKLARPCQFEGHLECDVLS